MADRVRLLTPVGRCRRWLSQCRNWCCAGTPVAEVSAGLRRSLAGVVLLALVLLAPGCVYRRLTIRTNPPGAIVEVNGKRIGTSPASMDFTYYGTYDIKLTRAGYETLTIKQPVAPPWYQIPPLDAVSDNLLPVQVTNRHDFLWNLKPLPPEAFDDERLRDRGQEYRGQARMGG